MNSAPLATPSKDFPDSIEEEAAGWLARRYGGLSESESAAFDAWLAADPRHASAAAKLERIWKTLSSPARAGQGERAQERARARARLHRRRRTRLALAGLTAATFAIAAFLMPATHRQTASEGPLRIAPRPDIRSLPDGSTVQFNAGAEIALAFTSSTRSVELLRGEALFEVAKDPSRPFVVTAGSIQVRAIGTAFAVRFSSDNVDVLVTKGTVAVERAATPAHDADNATPPSAPSAASDSLWLSAGQRTVLPLTSTAAPSAVTHLSPVEISDALAWRDRRIEFTHTALSEAVVRFNRQNQVQLAVADARTGSFEISGIFWADDPDAFLRLLETAFNMSVERSDGQAVVLSKQGNR